MTKDDGRWLVITTSALVVVVAVTIGVLRGLGLVDTRGGATDGDRLAAVLTFVGVMITAVVSVVGFTVTRQTERRLQSQHGEERERLRLDAAMRAGSLLNSTSTGPADAAAVGAGLLALTQLGHADLAVALLVDLWVPGEVDRVSTETAVLVLNGALASDHGNAQLIAAELLCRNATRLDPCQSLHWPSSIDGQWSDGFGPKTKLLLVDALVRMTYTSKANENSLRSISVRLYGIWKDDPDPRVKGCVGTLIAALLPAVKGLGYSDFMSGSRAVTLEQLEAAAAGAMANPDGLLERLVADRSTILAKWSSHLEGILTRPGSLATAH
ncbi:MAG: hypothetical protein ABIW46_05225 [Acidimicrobiales bacterium]